MNMWDDKEDIETTGKERESWNSVRWWQFPHLYTLYNKS
jgi:hypothetical protein